MNTFSSTLANTDFNFPSQHSFYHGKVRDMYQVGDQIISIVTDRISAFDVILPHTIPYKGQVLNQIAAYFLEKTQEIVPNWFESSPDPNVSIGKKAEPIRIEVVIRGYLTGHAWRLYHSGVKEICGVHLPSRMQKNQQFKSPIITPAIKSLEGHDEDISEYDLIHQNHISKQDWDIIRSLALKLFDFGQKMANDRGLILVDTKYEFGYYNDSIILIDEIHTPDSSRYFYESNYQEAFSAQRDPNQLSKEFVREWLISQGFTGKDGQKVPKMDDTIVHQISERYIELYEKITGKTFIKADSNNIVSRVEKNILAYLDNRKA